MNKTVNKSKKNTKVLLLSALAMVAVIGGTVGGTYAWFVANRTASGNVGQIGTNTVGDLQVSTDDQTYSGTFTITTKSITDVSGDGSTFYRPVIAAGSTSTSIKFSKVNAVAADDLGNYVIEQTVYFKSDKALKIYIGEGCDLTATAPGLDKAARVAFLKSDKSAVTSIIHESEDAELKYVQSTTLGADSALDLATIAGGPELMKMADIKQRTNTTDAASATLSPELVTLTESEPSVYKGSIVIRIWYEGTDSACVNDNKGNPASGTLNFYALDPADDQ